MNTEKGMVKFDKMSDEEYVWFRRMPLKGADGRVEERAVLLTCDKTGEGWLLTNGLMGQKTHCPSRSQAGKSAARQIALLGGL